MGAFERGKKVGTFERGRGKAKYLTIKQSSRENGIWRKKLNLYAIK